MNKLKNKSHESRSAILRWAGSKKKIVSVLKKYWLPKHTRYIEPFVGSAQLFISLNPKEAILGDVNSKLITTYLALKEDPIKVYNQLSKIPIGKDDYYKIREHYKTEKDEYIIAAQLIYLNRFCFNGLYRTNSKGEFNVPYSGIKTGNLPTLEDLILFSKSLQNAKIVNGDFQDTTSKELRSGDLVYMDPPYAIKNVRIFNQYNAQSFGINDIDRLEVLTDQIVESGADFLLSYASDKSIRDRFKKWNIQEIEINRNIAGFGKNRRVSNELLISNISIE